MENFIEKLKGLDKKVWIGIGIGAAVVIILIVALVIGLGNNKPTGGITHGGSQGGIFGGTQGGATENIGTEVFGTEGLGTEMETVIGTETEMTESESQSESQSQGGNTVTQPEDVGGVEQSPVTTTPSGEEILGAGSKDQPYEDIPDPSTMTLTTVSVPAGQTVYYSIQRTAGKWFEISDSDLYVIDSSGKRHDSSFQVESGLASDYILFQIGNKGGSAKSFTLKFLDIKGTWQNPERLSTAGQYVAHLSAGDEVGYHYKYIAEKKGTLRFYITSETSPGKCGLNVTNNNNMANRNFQAEVQEDSKGQYVELPADYVNAGDEIMIIVAAEKYRGEIPAADVTWEIVYVD